MTRRPFVPALAALALLLAACTGGSSGGTTAPSSVAASADPNAACATAPAPGDDALGAWSQSAEGLSVIPIIVSSRQVCGENRFLFSFLRDNQPVASPDRTVTAAFYNLGRDPETPVETVDADFVWAIEGERGIYVTNTSFAEAGEWGVEFRTSAPDAAEETIRVRFQVQPDSPTIGIGEQAPASDTPTADDVGGDLALLSTDDAPVPAFYETSVADALEAGKPFVLAFATPKFCTSAQCGPTLDQLKPIAEAHPDVTFINVEPYQLEAVDGQLQPDLDANGQLQPAPATVEWGLLTEPWIFVVDGDGVVRGSFELIAGPEEIEAVLGEVTAES